MSEMTTGMTFGSLWSELTLGFPDRLTHATLGFIEILSDPKSFILTLRVSWQKSWISPLQGAPLPDMTVQWHWLGVRQEGLMGATANCGAGEGQPESRHYCVLVVETLPSHWSTAGNTGLWLAEAWSGQWAWYCPRPGSMTPDLRWGWYGHGAGYIYWHGKLRGCMKNMS